MKTLERPSFLQTYLANNPYILKPLTDTSEWIYENIGIDLYDNQIEVSEAVVDLGKSDVIIIGSRGGGKTMAVGCSLIKLCVENQNFRVGVFAPKWSQATRVIKEIQPYLENAKCKIKNLIDWKSTVKTRMQFVNGSFIQCISANELANIEGEHFHLIIIDEAHLVPSISVSQKISPMLGSFNVAKTVKIGVAMYDNHFHKSFLSPSYSRVIKSWLECPILLNSGSMFIDGKEYPKKAFGLMPLTLKQKLFPLHPEIFTEGGSDMDESDFITQYMVQWVSDSRSGLSDEEQLNLKGDHAPELQGYGNELYVFGLDFAQGSVTGNDEDRDYTALAIWKITDGGIKRKIYAKSWKGNPLSQITEIISIVKPIGGLFPCKVGMVDFSGVGAVAVSAFQQENIQATGVMFAQTEKASGKNYKNAMWDNFKFELAHQRVKYPSEVGMSLDKDIYNGYLEWCQIEKKERAGINKTIQAPEGFHDDHVCADMLAVFVANRADVASMSRSTTLSMPTEIVKMPTLIGVNPSQGYGKFFLTGGAR